MAHLYWAAPWAQTGSGYPAGHGEQRAFGAEVTDVGSLLGIDDHVVAVSGGSNAGERGSFCPGGWSMLQCRISMKGGTMRRLVIPLVLLLVLGLAVGAMACGGNDEEEIRALVDKEIAALNDVDLETVYNQKTPSYRSRVSAEEYEAFILMAYADFLPLVESGQAEVEVTDVEIEVDGEWAYMTGKLGLNGKNTYLNEN